MQLTTLNQLIKRSGLKKKFIARKCGLTSMELSHILKGRRNPKPGFDKRLKTFLIKFSQDD